MSSSDEGVGEVAPPAHAAARAAQVQRMLARREALAAHLCPRCGLTRGTYCVCATLTSVLVPCTAVRHKLTLCVHPREWSRASSSHRILLSVGRGASAARAVQWLGPHAPSVHALWEDVERECGSSGQTPVILYPGSGERVHSPASLIASLSPPALRAGLHILVLDGTWRETRSMARELPTHAHLLALGPADIVSEHSLFQPLRKQAGPARICTAEAVACTLDALAAADSSLASSASFAVRPLPPSSSPPALHDVLLPSIPHLPSRRLRYGLAVLVDGLVLQNGLVDSGQREGPERGARGVGYRTWRFGEGGGHLFGRLPSWIVEKIAVLAYGRERVACAGYRERHARSVAEWRPHEGSGPERGERLEGGAFVGRWVRTKFPSPSPFTAVPLALTSRDFLEWAAGGRRTRRCGAPTPAAAAGEDAA
jgi:DTW domain-containing protein YfiP